REPAGPAGAVAGREPGHRRRGGPDRAVGALRAAAGARPEPQPADRVRRPGAGRVAPADEPDPVDPQGARTVPEQPRAAAPRPVRRRGGAEHPEAAPMTDEEAFLKAICDQPEDDTPRLV